MEAQDVQTDDVEQTPEAQDSFESLEDKVLQAASEEGAPEGQEEPTVEEQIQQLFDLNGKLSVKAGDKLSAEHIKELERGWLRESDYTKKTQELARDREEAIQINNSFQQVSQGQKNGREFLSDQTILSWFKPQELMNIGLSSVGVPVQLWNEFLEYHQQNGGQNVNQFQGDALHQHISPLKQQLERLEKNYQQFTNREQEMAYERQMQELNTQVNTALSKYSGVNRKELLVELAHNTTGESVEQVAKRLYDATEKRFQDYIKSKTSTQQKRLTPANGSRIPIMPKAPKTFEEVDSMIDQMMNR